MGVVLRLHALIGRALVISAMAVGMIPHAVLAMPAPTGQETSNRLSSALVTGSAAGLGNDNIPGEPISVVLENGYYYSPRFTPSPNYTGLPPVDVFQIDVEAGDLISIWLDPPVTGAYFGMYLFSPSATDIWTDRYLVRSYRAEPEPGYLRLRTIAEQSGTYYLAVVNWYNPQADYYSMMLNTHRLSGDDDIPGAIVPGPEETFRTGSLDWMSDWSDVYAFEIEEDEEYTFELEFLHERGRSLMWSYPPGTTTVWGDFPSEYSWTTAEFISHLKYHCPPGGAGTFYLEVGTASQHGDYVLSWTRSKPRVTTISNIDRYMTSYSISRANFARSESVVLATGSSYADALAASSLAGALDAPLLLVPKASQGVQMSGLYWELGRLGVRDCYLVGGTGAIPGQIKTWLNGLGYNTTRISGADRYATAAAVAQMVANLAPTAPATAFVVRGDDYPDALSCAPYAYSQGIPILLTRPTRLPEATRGFLDSSNIKDVVIAGGGAAVSSGVKGNIASLNGGTTVTRIAGTTRYSTSTKMAEYAVKTRGWGSYAFTGVAVGTNFPDALSGGTAVGSREGVLLLTRPDRLSDDLYQTVLKRGSEMQAVQCFGGQLRYYDVTLGQHLP